ncbi:hypothetical protein C5167_048678 [Papaver somniferum]|uniref:Uncharacterized protein n=1 Tax=Papaver somniferum TaxID=3469 RepID=A0A4Y7KMN0_PAPSO|nr:hypothetical protein C5167_048678 [Papaver somniferum]
MLNCMKRKAPTSSARVGTPSPEKGSNSHLGHQHDQGLDHDDNISNEFPSLQLVSGHEGELLIHVEAKEKDQADANHAILKILVGAKPKNSFSSFSIGVKDNPLKQPRAQQKEYDQVAL